MADQKKTCPNCGSDDILPFESEDDYKDDYSLTIIFLAALLVTGAYFLFVVSSYIYFPFVLFIFIIAAAKMVNRREKQRKKQQDRKRDYICLECSSSFNA